MNPMKANVKGIFTKSAAVVAASVGVAGTALADNVTLPNPIGCGTFGCVTTNVINFLITIAIPLCAIMVLIGGFKMITSSGDPEKFKSGRNTILYAVAGFAVVILAKGISAGIQSFFQ